MALSHYTTKHDFRVFSQAVRLWVDRLGLTDWRVTLLHQNNSEVEHARASFSAYVSDRVATVYLEPDWKTNKPSDFILEKCALHEVAHILFATLTDYAAARYIGPCDIANEEHAIIHRLEDVFYGGIEDESNCVTRRKPEKATGTGNKSRRKIPGRHPPGKRRI